MGLRRLEAEAKNSSERERMWGVRDVEMRSRGGGLLAGVRG